MSSKNRIECIVVIKAKENKNAKVYFQFDGINKNGQVRDCHICSLNLFFDNWM